MKKVEGNIIIEENDYKEIQEIINEVSSYINYCKTRDLNPLSVSIGIGFALGSFVGYGDSYFKHGQLLEKTLESVTEGFKKTLEENKNEEE